MLTREDIAAGLRRLGLAAGDRVMVHSSMAALGPVDGGADAVIDALLDVVGANGLVAMPTFACKAPFDRRSSVTPLGAIPERFWRRDGAVRSLHPTHSIAAMGRGAEDLIRDHEKAPTAYAENTPYHNLAMGGGKVLLLGVDQDRNTTLHAAEALAGSPYLTDIEGTYVDDEGREVTIPIAAMAGPHRDFIGLDSLFRERGVMDVGRIGRAVCRLMDGRAMIETALEALRGDPAAVLCENPACGDCVMQRGRIKAARLAGEDLALAAVFGDIYEGDPGDVIDALRAEGISAVELTADEYGRYGALLAQEGVSVAAIRSAPDAAAAELAARLGVPVIVPVASVGDFKDAERLAESTGACVLMMNDGSPAAFYEDLYERFAGAPALAFSPAGFAKAGEKPFLGVFYRGRLRKRAVHFYVDDFRQAEPAGYALPGRGNGEVKEIISMLRCRSYDGVLTLRSREGGVDGFRESAAAFWKLLDTM